MGALPETDLSDASLSGYEGCFLDRELSWLAFNDRVLSQAEDPAVPLLERLKFLSIYHSNLDEFFMVRVGSLTHRSVLFPYFTDPKTGFTAAVQLKKILQYVADSRPRVQAAYRTLVAELKAADIDVVDFRHLSKTEEALTRKLFEEYRPLLSPQVVDSRHPMPFLFNNETYVACALSSGNESSIGLVPLYRLPPYQLFETQGRQKVSLTSRLICHYAPRLFKKYQVQEACVLRLTRNADVFIEEDVRSSEADYRADMERMLRKRKRQQPVRLQIDGKPSGRFQALLEKKLEIPSRSTFVSTVPFCLSFGSKLHRGEGMTYDERRPVRTVKLQKGEYFSYLEKHDLLLSFPYQSMNPFIDMLYEAADDPEVLSIRITLYRLAASSKLAAALAYAADRGKDVLCLLELRARFDEQNNIDYSQVLEDAGCTVIYGLPDQKVHSKLCLITRRRGSGVSYITQVGTGNYNEVTAELYCDLSLITSDEQTGRDAAAVFDALSLGQVPPLTEKLWVAPLGYKSRLLSFLRAEKEKGPEGFVSLKANSLNDIDVMRALIDCSRAGATVELFLRGICCLRPGIPGSSENITVRSVVGRHLEHSRIFVFGRGEDQRIFIGSGDMLNRNTRRRVEAFIEVTTPETRTQVLEVMEAFRQDKEKGRLMQPDGSYVLEPGGEGTASQDWLYRYFTALSVGPAPEPEPAPDLEPDPELAAPEEPAPGPSSQTPEQPFTFADTSPEAEKRLPPEPAPEPVLTEQPAPRRGFFARLFRRRRK